MCADDFDIFDWLIVVLFRLRFCICLRALLTYPAYSLGKSLLHCYSCQSSVIFLFFLGYERTLEKSAKVYIP
jgi:hypothetical protein